MEAWFNAEEGVLQRRELSPAGGRFPEALGPISPPFPPEPLFLNVTCLDCFRRVSNFRSYLFRSYQEDETLGLLPAPPSSALQAVCSVPQGVGHTPGLLGMQPSMLSLAIFLPGPSPLPSLSVWWSCERALLGDPALICTEVAGRPPCQTSTLV